MEFLGLIAEFLFLAMAIYVYLFATGRVQPGGDAQRQERAREFRDKNGWWLRLAALALLAVMSMNIYLHISDLMGK